MRLWHYKMIPILPHQQLLELHREVCALRGLAWGRKHSTVDYVFNHSWEYLFNYHQQVIAEMKIRTYKPNPIWTDYYYRGKRCNPLKPDWTVRTRKATRYPEHNKKYKIQCAQNLSRKIRQAPAGKYNEIEVHRFWAWVIENDLPIE